MHVNKADGVMFCMRLMELLRRGLEMMMQMVRVNMLQFGGFVIWLPWQNKRLLSCVYLTNYRYTDFV